MSRGYRGKATKRNGCSARADVGRVQAPRLSVVKSVPRSRLTAGVVVWAHVPFRDGSGEKARPAVVVATSSHDVVILPVTTSPNRHRHPNQYVELHDLDRAGILHPSAVALTPVTVRRIDLVNITGELSAADAERVLGPFTEAGADLVGRYADAV